MNFKQISHEKKPLLHREEFLIEIEDSKTPSNAELRKSISEKMGKDEKLILIKKINQSFGVQKTSARFYIYHDEDSIKRFERFRKPKTAEAAK